MQGCYVAKFICNIKLHVYHTKGKQNHTDDLLSRLYLPNFIDINLLNILQKDFH